MVMISPGSSSGYRPVTSHTPTPTPTPTSTAYATTVLGTIGLLIVFALLGVFWAAIFGGLAGAVAAWIQRAFRIRSHLGKRLMEGLLSPEFWTAAPGTALPYILLHVLVGTAVGGAMALAHWSVALDGVSVLAGGVGGGGGPPPAAAIGWFIFLVALITAALFAILSPLFVAGSILTRMKVQGKSEKERGRAAALLLHRSEAAAFEISERANVRAATIWPSAVEGAISGALVSLIWIAIGWGR